MEYRYEIVQGEAGMPIRAIIHSVDGFHMHWHNEMEFLLVLKGSINIRIGDTNHYMKENDFILVNCNELHSTRRTDEKNTLLAVQIDPDFYSNCLTDFSKVNFNCKSFDYLEEEQERFDIIRYYIAKMVWELNKKDQGHRLKVGSYLYLLGDHLLNNYDYTLVDDQDKELKDNDFPRLQRIIEYVDENINRKITLKEIAEREHFNYYYLSHFIKDKMGMSFQEYLNSTRLSNALDALLGTDKAITEIAQDCGFPNMNSFNRLFKEAYNCTPTEYRKKHGNDSDLGKPKRSKTYLDVDRDAALKKLFTYIDLCKDETKVIKTHRTSIEKININKNKTGMEVNHYWKNLITFGRAREGLGASWQNQLKEIQREIGFNYIRFHGIFNDEMMIYNISPEGMVEYNWTYVDELFDFLLSIGLKPFVELGFMPSELKRSDETIFWWEGNISPPKDIKQWTALVEEFVRHCINRYGIEEVKSWYFEVWNEPEYTYIFWAGSKEEYFEFYKETVLTIKSISEELKVGGPAITHGTILGSRWLDDFLLFCERKNIPLDFLSMHIYPEYIPKDDMEKAILEYENGADILEVMPKTRRVYYDKDHTPRTMDTIKEKADMILSNKPEIHITEWNASSQFGNLIHDTCYVAIYIIKNILESIGKVDSLGYWTFTDIFEENKLGISHFHGGFGLINKDGLKKSSYYAYYFLAKLGDEIIGQGEDYIITRSGENIQILAYNYTYFDNLFLSGEISHICHENRYSIYETKDIKELEFNIEDIAGDYRVISYKLNRKSGSVFDEWVKMGLPENMTEEEIKYLQGKGQPEMMVEYKKLKGEYKKTLHIPVHGAEMIILEKKL